MSDAFICLLIAALIILPYIPEKFGYRVSDALLIFLLFYMLASMMGRVYKLFYIVTFWDKLLHFCGGVAFALIGSYIPALINRDYEQDRLLRVLFGFLFSVSIAALWEFWEYGADRLLGTDMQRDTIITCINSYNLGDSVGVIGSIDNIESVLINGEEIEGYIDIGLIDTMGDMIVETLGAAFYALIFALDKGRHSAVYRLETAAEDSKSAFSNEQNT